MKRKYTRKAVQSKSSTVKGERNRLILNSIERVLEYRKNLGLPDDREERIERALRYQKFRKGRKWRLNVLK